MRYLSGFLLLLRILIFLSVHSLHWLVSIVFIAEIGFDWCNTLKLISVHSSCLDGFLFFGRILLKCAASESDHRFFVIIFWMSLKCPAIRFLKVC